MVHTCTACVNEPHRWHPKLRESITLKLERLFSNLAKTLSVRLLWWPAESPQEARDIVAHSSSMQALGHVRSDTPAYACANAAA